MAREGAVRSALRDLTPMLTSGSALGGGLVEPTDPAYQERKRRAIGALAMYAPQQLAAIEGIQRKRTEDLLAAQDRQRQTVLGELYTKDPEGAVEEATQAGDFDLAKTFRAMSKEDREATGNRLKAAAPVAYQLGKIPYEQRRAALAQQAPILEVAGWTRELIDNFDPTDEALGGLVSTAMTVKDMIERDTPKPINLQPGAGYYERNPDGTVVERIRPNTGGVDFGTPVGAAHPAEGEVAATLSASLPAPVVAGFLGNFHAEGGYGGASGDGGSASGIAQWRGERQANFQRVLGKPVSQATPQEQAKFVLWEMQNPEAAGMTIGQRDAILAARTPGEAAALIDQHYERSSGEHRQRRVAAAEQRGAGGGNAPAASDMRRMAQEAIAAGADPAKVKQRAAEMGVQL